jgi:hypothetical protein
MVLVACGEDAEKRHAAYDVLRATADDGLGYRLRFLAPPWDPVSTDGLVTGQRKSIRLSSGEVTFETGTARVVEIERESIIQGSGTLPKYRAEAAIAGCDLALAPGESCAQRKAVAELAARQADGEMSLFSGVRSSENDFGQAYYELATLRTDDPRRYHRVAFFETPIPTRYALVRMEGTPRLDEKEVSLMLDAFEVFAPAALGSNDDAGVGP